MAKVVISRQAQTDAIHIASYLYQKAGLSVAAEYLNHFDGLYAQWKDFPESGALRTTLGPLVRIGIVPPYTVLYEYDAPTDTVTVFRIVHGSRKITGDMLYPNDQR